MVTIEGHSLATSVVMGSLLDELETIHPGITGRVAQRAAVAMRGASGPNVQAILDALPGLFGPEHRSIFSDK